VLLAIVGCAFLVKRILPANRTLFPSQAIQVIGKRSLSSNASLFLVQIGSRIFHLGVTKESVSLLGEITDRDEIALIKSQSPHRRSDSMVAVFRNLLESSLRRSRSADGEVQRRRAFDDRVKAELENIRSTVRSWRAGKEQLKSGHA
jgi:flagellar biogenesis protein FliO